MKLFVTAISAFIAVKSWRTNVIFKSVVKTQAHMSCKCSVLFSPENKKWELLKNAKWNLVLIRFTYIYCFTLKSYLYIYTNPIPTLPFSYQLAKAWVIIFRWDQHVYLAQYSASSIKSRFWNRKVTYWFGYKMGWGFPFQLNPKNKNLDQAFFSFHDSYKNLEPP